jgi:uncharacterized membrane protein
VVLEFAFLGFAGIALALLILWYSRKFAKLEAQVARLRSEIENLRSLVESQQREVETTSPQSAAVETPEASIPAGLRSESEPPFHSPSMPPIAGDTPVLSRQAPPPRPRGSSHFEALVGGNWLLMIGIFAIVLGCLYFLKQVFDNRWIGDIGRVLIGSLSGLAFLYAGERFQKKGYKLYGQAIAGGGISILYLSLYASFNFYSLLPQAWALFLMALVTAAASLLSARYSSKTLAVLGVLGGILTPYWLSTDINNQIGLLGYLIILDSGMGLVALWRGWPFLNVLSFIGTVGLFWNWADRFYTRNALWTTEIFLVLFLVLYVCLCEGLRRRLEKAKSPGLLEGTAVVLFFISSQAILGHDPEYYWWFLLIFDALALSAGLRVRTNRIAPGIFVLNALGIAFWIAVDFREPDRLLVFALLTGVFLAFLVQSILGRLWSVFPADLLQILVVLGTGLGYFGASYRVLRWSEYHPWMGSFALVLALVYLYAARLLRRDREGSTVSLAFIGVSVTLVTLSIPIELEQNWVTLSWAAESVVLTWIGFRIASVRIRQTALAVLIVCLFRLFAWDAFEPLSQYAPVFNRRVFSFLAAIAAVYLMAMFYRRNFSSTEPWERPVHTGLILLANGVTVFLITQELWAYHEDRLRQLALSAGRKEVSASEFGSLAEQVRNRRQLILSLLWSVYSIAAVAVGIVYRYRPIRLFGIALFFVAIVKVFSVDIWTLRTLYRVLSFISLGCLLLAVSFLYQRFKKVILETSPVAGEKVIT